MTKTRVLVTGVGGRSVGAGILHALMRIDPLVRDRWEVLATDADPFSWGLYVADERTLVPPAGSPGYLDAILDIVDRKHIAAIVPGTESEASLMAEHRADIPVPVVANEAQLMPLMMDKNKAAAKLAELGVNVIPSYPWTQRADAVTEFGFPLFVKRTRHTGGSRGVHLVVSQSELDALVPFVEPQYDPIVQPYVGDGDSEYTVGVLTDRSGQLIDSIAMRRKLIGLSLLDAKPVGASTATVSTGISQGFIVRDANIQEFCEDLAQRLGSRGPMNLQLRVSHGEFYVFEIHPRFSGTTPIRASAGFNEPDMLLRNQLLGEEFGRVDYRQNVAAIRALEHVLVPVGDMCA